MGYTVPNREYSGGEAHLNEDISAIGALRPPPEVVRDEKQAFEDSGREFHRICRSVTAI